MKKICDFVKACVILHNTMLSAPYDEELIDERFKSVFNPDLDSAVDSRREQILLFPRHLDRTYIQSLLKAKLSASNMVGQGLSFYKSFSTSASVSPMSSNSFVCFSKERIDD